MKFIRKPLSGNATTFIRTWHSWTLMSKPNFDEIEGSDFLFDIGLEEGDSGIAPPYEGLLKIKKLYHKQKRRTKRTRITATLCAIAIALSIALLILNESGQKNYVRFDDAPIKNVFDVFEDRYNILIEAQDSGIMNCRFTGTFLNVNANEMAISVARSLGLGFEIIEKNKFKLTGSSCL